MEERQHNPTSSDTKPWNAKFRIDNEHVIPYLVGGTAIAILHTDSPIKKSFDHIRIKVVADKLKDYKWLIYLQVKKGQLPTLIGYLFRDTNGQYFCMMNTEEYVAEYKVVRYFIFHLQRNTLPDFMHVYHLGKCSKCKRDLTDVDSLRYGIGPVCRGER